MLSTNSSSSIQKRRQTHRRQQSLEVPILATPLPANPRRNQQAHHGHRRGLSLDQSLSALHTPIGFRPLQSQDSIQPSGSPSHFVQETQQQRTPVAQPGYLPQDFQSHLQQQLNGNVNVPLDIKPVIASPQPQTFQQQRALQELENHMAWYRNNFTQSPNANMQPAQFFDASQQTGVGAPMPMLMTQPMQGMPQTPVIQGHARTVPNTPQASIQTWPSPPPTHAKHGRSQSFQLDVAPMPHTVNNSFATESFTQPLDSFVHDSAPFVNDASYASSAYSSSAIDPLSPRPQQGMGPLPTLFEEPDGQHVPGPFDGTSILLQATAGAEDFNDPNFDFDGPMGMSPRQQLIDSLGPDVPASIVETGVLAYEVQQYIGELSEADNKYGCMWEGCGRRFGRKENVRAHVQTHLGDRQFKCNLCDKTFVRQHDLKRHIAIHSDDRPHICPCGTGFARHDALTRHRQRGMCPGALPGFEKTEEEKPKRGRPKKERPTLDDRTDKASKQRKKNKAKESSGTDDEPEVQIIYASSSSGGSDRSFPVTPPDTSDVFDTDAFLNMANTDIAYNPVTSSWRDTPPTSPVSVSPTKTADNTIDQIFDFSAPMHKNVSVSPAALSTHSSPPTYNVDVVAASVHSPPDSNHDNLTYASPSASGNAGGSFDGGSFDGGSSPAEMLWFEGPDAVQAQAEAVYNHTFSPAGESNAGSSVYNYSDHDAEMFERELEQYASTAAPGAALFATAMPQGEDGPLAGLLDDWLMAH
ncbi:Metallothionein expression activator [Teratosphaeriaceae sp. CCFEE 6253]|nr:Metallothionein expression activator [Teratosphaeriaceae sp. CCFEE 6253]